MKIYNYSHLTGEFLSEGMADPSPLEKSVYLIPANATTIAPPKTKKGEVACYNQGKWEIKPDYRGESVYNQETGDMVVISKIGSLPVGFQKEKPFIVEKQNKIDKDRTNYIKALNGVYKIKDININIDSQSLNKINGQSSLILLNKISGGDPLDIVWFDDENIGHNYKENEFIEMAQSVCERIREIETKHSKNFQAFQKVKSLKDLDEIDINY